MLHEQHLDIPLAHSITNGGEAGFVLLIRERRFLREAVEHVEGGGSAGDGGVNSHG